MAFSTDDLEVIERAIATGELRVRYADREVEYRSIEDLIKARRLILNGLNGRAKQTRVVADKGF